MSGKLQPIASTSISTWPGRSAGGKTSVYSSVAGSPHMCATIAFIASPRSPVRWILARPRGEDRKSTRLNSSHVAISYAVFCLKKKKEPSCLQPLKGGELCLVILLSVLVLLVLVAPCL